MGRGTSGAAEVPAYEGVFGSADDDARLVAAVRRGDDRAFEHLYSRYHRRINAYVLGMVKDYGRAEDVTQEVFVSALRRMRETEQPLAFKPWLYQIAKNSCIDAFRRSKRAEEVSYDADDALAPADHSKLVGSGPSPDAAVAAKQDLESLCGAFGGLSETHHEILVLRELEGLSYQEIGRRMGMSRPAVESTLFRARRRLSEEFDDIVSGARCQRIQAIIATAASSRLGLRDTRRLARHLAHCQPCRREALAAGLDRGLFARPTVRERVATKVAGVLPFPIFFRFRREAADAAAATPAGSRSAGLVAHMPLLSDQLSSGWGKAAAGAALLIAGVGAGVGVHEVRTPSAPPPASAAARSGPPAAAPVAHKATRTAASVAPAASAPKASTATPRHRKSTKKLSEAAHRNSVGSGSSTAAGRATTTGGGTTQPAASEPASSGAAPSASSGGGSHNDAKPPKVKTPDAPKVPPVQDTVKQTTGAVQDTTQQTTSTVRDTTHAVTDGVDATANQVAGGTPVAPVVSGVTKTVDGAVDGATGAVDQTIDQVTGGLNGLGGAGG